MKTTIATLALILSSTVAHAADLNAHCWAFDFAGTRAYFKTEGSEGVVTLASNYTGWIDNLSPSWSASSHFSGNPTEITLRFPASQCAVSPRDSQVVGCRSDGPGEARFRHRKADGTALAEEVQAFQWLTIEIHRRETPFGRDGLNYDLNIIGEASRGAIHYGLGFNWSCREPN